MAGAVAARRRATHEDVLALPEHQVGEILDGELHVQPRPRSLHAQAAVWLDRRLGPPFDDGIGGPGGWWILIEPELHLGDDIVVPDLAGWRRARMPEFPDVAHFTLAPDWACEIPSASTEHTDRSRKLRIFAREGVSDAWLVNPRARTLEVLRRQGDLWLLVTVYEGETRVRAEPFEAIELDLGSLWPAAQTL